MKKCSKCKIEKYESDFWKRKDRENGLSSACRDCCNAKRKENPELLRASKNAWSAKNREKLRERSRKYREENPEKAKEFVRNSRDKKLEEYQAKARERYARNREVYHATILRQREKKDWKFKHNARMILNQHLDRGNIEKPDYCQICNENKKLDGHHADYNKPLDVVWVCRKCHSKIHRN